jgi:hypothetical protein
LTEGERIEIEARGGEIVLRGVVPHFTLDEPFRGPARRSGGLLTRALTTGGRTLAVSASRNDGAGLHSRRRLSDLDRL